MAVSPRFVHHVFPHRVKGNGVHAFDRHFATVRDVAAALQPSYPVYCLHLDEIRKQARAFLDAFPGRVLYAVKCNPHPQVLRVLYEQGVRHFDTASLSEVALIRESYSDANAYFMHPVKARAAIQTAHEVYGVEHWVVDHKDELRKLAQELPCRHGQAVFVRLATPNFRAAFQLSEKFGARLEDAADLLRAVVKEGFQPGIAFHVGSQCRSPNAYRNALQMVRAVLEGAGVAIQFLDVGGGFPVHYEGDRPPPLNYFFTSIAEEVKNLPLRGDCVLMCEPGRSLVASGCSLLTQVQLRKEGQIYLNDGVYHSLSETLSSDIRYPVRLIRLSGHPSSDLEPFKVFGPTCDSSDVLPYQVLLPTNVREGDWVEFGQVGAYSNAMRTTFNGFYPETFVTVKDDPLFAV